LLIIDTEIIQWKHLMRICPLRTEYSPLDIKGLFTIMEPIDQLDLINMRICLHILDISSAWKGFTFRTHARGL